MAIMNYSESGFARFKEKEDFFKPRRGEKIIAQEMPTNAPNSVGVKG